MKTSLKPSHGFNSTELTDELVVIRDEIQAIARGYGLDFFDTIYEMIDHHEMNAFAAFGGFPVRYPHWRFGMDYDQLSKSYEWGLQKIYEMVINTNPSYAYLMKANSMVEQKTVMAHVYGHVDFFKNNYWFSKTNRKMLDAMANHAVQIRTYMDRYGQDTVENFIDQVHAIENLIDPFLPFQEPKKTEKQTNEADKVTETGKLKVQRSYMDNYINPPEYLEEQKAKQSNTIKQDLKNPPSPDKDIMGFILKNAHALSDWQSHILEMLRDEAYYFAPQAQTKIMNEGWASYWHSKIMTEKVLKASEVIDFCDSHAGTLATQPGRINPYKIGIELFRDIEDRWNRGAFGKDYEECENLVEKAKWDKKLNKGREKIFEVRKVCNDLTFIDQYLTPEFVERFKLYHYAFNQRTNQYEIVDRDFKNIKEGLLKALTNRGQPFIYVIDSNDQNRGELRLWHKFEGQKLDPKWTRETMKAIAHLWGRPVNLETAKDDKKLVYRMELDEKGRDHFSEQIL